MIVVPEIRRPRPAPHLDAGLPGYIFELSIAEVVIESIASRVLAIKCADIFWRLFVEQRLL